MMVVIICPPGDRPSGTAVGGGGGGYGDQALPPQLRGLLADPLCVPDSTSTSAGVAGCHYGPYGGSHWPLSIMALKPPLALAITAAIS